MNAPPNWSTIAHSAPFRSLLTAKIRFIAPMTLFFLAFYFTLPLMTSYSHTLNTPVIGAITGAWLFAFAQFVMTWTLCALYTRRAAQFDALAAQILHDTGVLE